MASSIVDIFEKLKIRNDSPVWLWSMMLTRGLTWDNVWDVFKNGVSKNNRDFSRDPSDRIPGLDMFFCLPQSPLTAVELFERLGNIRAHYPRLGPNAHGVFKIDDLISAFFKNGKDVVQVTWPHVKTILARTTTASSAGETADAKLFLEIYCCEDPRICSKTLLHMAQTQHHLVGTHVFTQMARTCDDETIGTVWASMMQKKWDNPLDTVKFLSTFLPKTERFSIPAHQAFSFMKEYPTLIEHMEWSILTYAKTRHNDNALFFQARELLAPYPDAVINLHVAMDRSISLFEMKRLGIQHSQSTKKILIKPLLLAYQSMHGDERDTPESQNYFANVFHNVSIAMEDYNNGNSNRLMVNIVEQSPSGVIARILALHSCQVGLFPGRCSEQDIKQIKAIFKHDPRTKTGHAAIIKKFIPEFKEWFVVVQTLGLTKPEMWEQGLNKMAGTNPDALMDLDTGIFEPMGP